MKNGKTRRSVSKEQHAYERLREDIVSGEFVPGETLVQMRLATRFGVSATPVRAAVRRLMAEGLITQEHHHPPKVAKMAVNDLEETRLVREHLEGWALTEAVSRITSQQLRGLKAHLNKLDAAVQNNDMPLFGYLNKQFHLAIYAACPYRLLFNMIKDLWDRTDRYRVRAMFSLVPHLAELSQADHHRLIKAIEQGAADEAMRLTSEHNARARKLFLDYLRCIQTDRTGMD